MKFNNILLIDDDEDDQEIFLTAVEEVCGATCCTALSDAREALEKLQKKELTPDAIVLDLNMPMMNGQQFLSTIKKIEGLRDIPVIIFTTSSHAATIQLTKDMGALEFITKPDNYDVLVNILSGFLINKAQV